MIFALIIFEFTDFIFCIQIGPKKCNQPKNLILNIDLNCLFFVRFELDISFRDLFLTITFHFYFI